MKKTTILMLLLVLAAHAAAQDRRISGQITDRDTKEGVVQCTVQLLKTDSSFVAGTLTDEKGAFSMQAPADGQYLLRLSSVGYITQYRAVKVAESKNVSLGSIALRADAVMLKEATVTGMAARMTVVEDTFIYNAAAYRVPEGSVVEELVKKLPGAQVDDDGTITINGKTVKKIKVDGKEFMTGDTKVAMKNLPTSIVDKVKAYDEKSDLARITGIDDGNESTVLDFGLKPGMHKGKFGNIDLSIGTKSRYSEKLMGAYMNERSRLMALGSANNVNDRGFPGGGGGGRFGGGRNGLTATKMAGLNFNYEKRKKLQIDGSLAWNHSDTDSRTETASENFVSTASSFSNSLSQSYNRSNSIDGRLKIEWKPDSMTNIILNPNLNYSTGDGRSGSRSAAYSEDPYQYADNPMDEAAIGELVRQQVMVNTRGSQSASYNDRLGAGASLQLNRKLNRSGRNVTLRASINYNDNQSKSLSETDVHLYQVLDMLGNDSAYVTNRYNVTPTRSWSYTVQTTYSEPILKNVFLQFNYQFNYRYNKSDRSTYDFSDLSYSLFDLYGKKYGGWGSYFATLQSPIDSYLDSDLSRFSEYSNYIHELRTTLRIIRQKYQLNAGFMVQPQKSHYVQDYQGVSVDTVRHTLNFSPTLNFRYRFSRISRLEADFRGTTSQPSMSDLLDITDDSDPLNIKKGNPGLKPSFQSNFRLSYNNYFPRHQQTLSTHASYSNTRNSISNMVTYNEQTGGRTTRPENINGNWNGSLGITFNTALDTLGVWNLNNDVSYSYSNYVGFVNIDRNASSQKNTTRSTGINDRMQLTYRKNWFEATLDGNLRYAHVRNLLQSQNNRDTWQFSYGGSINIFTDGGFSISTDIHQQSRRGYSDATMNTNELIWNVQLSQSFLRGKPLVVTMQFYDILHQQSNFSRTINAMMRSDTQYNAITSYAMLHVIYRMNAFGNKEARRAMRGMPRNFGDDFRMGGGQRGGNRGGAPGGGFGGGRGGRGGRF